MLANCGGPSSVRLRRADLYVPLSSGSKHLGGGQLLIASFDTKRPHRSQVCVGPAHSPATFLSKVGRSKAPVRMGIAEATLAAAATNEIICSNVGHRDAWCDASSHQWSRLRSLKGAGGLAICPGYGHEGRHQYQEAHVAHGSALYLCAISTSASTTIAAITQSAR